MRVAGDLMHMIKTFEIRPDLRLQFIFVELEQGRIFAPLHHGTELTSQRRAMKSCCQACWDDGLRSWAACFEINRIRSSPMAFFWEAGIGTFVL